MPTSSQHRRYEILLPLQHNDGQPVPEALVAETLLELRQRFGALSAESQTIRGEWVYQGQLYRDNSMRIFLDVPDLAEHHQFFVEFKERLKTRFGQLAIWITSHPIDVL